MNYNTIPKAFNPPLRSSLYYIRKLLLQKIVQYSSLLQGKLLDFGCGAKPYKSLFTNVSEYVGVDYSSEGHSHANEHIEFFYDGKTLPFDDGSFGSIFSSEVFEHIFNLEEIIPELHRVLQLNGKILITCPFVMTEHEVPIDYARYTQFALKHLFEKNGFKIIKIDKSGDFLVAIHQMLMLYLSEHFLYKIPLLGNIKAFTSNIRPIIIYIFNALFYVAHAILPKTNTLYLNNIVLAEKI